MQHLMQSGICRSTDSTQHNAAEGIVLIADVCNQPYPHPPSHHHPHPHHHHHPGLPGLSGEQERQSLHRRPVYPLCAFKSDQSSQAMPSSLACLAMHERGQGEEAGGDAGDGGIVAADFLIWLLDEREMVEAAASAVDTSGDFQLRHLAHSVETWIRYFGILRSGNSIQLPIKSSLWLLRVNSCPDTAVHRCGQESSACWALDRPMQVTD